MKKGVLRRLNDFTLMTSAAMITGSVSALLPYVVAFADEGEGGGSFGFGIDDAIGSGKTNSALDPIATTVQGAGNSLYKIVFFAFVFISIIGIVVSAIKIITSNAQSRQEAKSDVVWKAVGALIGFAAVGAVTLLAGIGAGLFDGK